MQTERTITTTAEPVTLQTEQTYYNSWDGRVFAVVSISEDTVTVAYMDGEVASLEPYQIEVDFERIHPCEVSQ